MNKQLNVCYDCLDEPVTTKISSNKSGENVEVGTCIMQGYRKSLEDTCNICIDYDDGVSFFALYDGHGGHEVAAYCAKELPEFIKTTYAYTKGDISTALTTGITQFDLSLLKPEVTKVMKGLSQVDISKKLEDENDDETDCDDESEGENKNISDKIPENESKNNDFNTATKDNELDEKKSNNPDSNNTNENLNCTTENDESPKECASTDPEKNLESSQTIDIPDNSEKVEDQASSNEIESIEKCSEKSVEIDNFESNEEIIIYDEDDSDYDDYSNSEYDDDGDNDDDDDDEDDDCDDEDDDDGIKIKTVKNNDDDDDDDEIKIKLDHLDYGEILDAKYQLIDSEDDIDGDDDFYVEDPNEFVANLYKQPGYKSGCTAIVVILTENKIHVGNTGDSRCVICCDGQALELSDDHVPFMKAEVERLQAGRKIGFCGQVYRKLKLARTLGDHRYKRDPVFPFLKPVVTASATVKSHIMKPNQVTFAVIASNGVWNCMSSKKVIKFVNERINTTKKLSKICEELLDHCLAIPKETHEAYNMSVILIKFKSANGITTESSKVSINNIRERMNNLALVDVSESKMRHVKRNIATY